MPARLMESLGLGRSCAAAHRTVSRLGTKFIHSSSAIMAKAARKAQYLRPGVGAGKLGRRAACIEPLIACRGPTAVPLPTGKPPMRRGRPTAVSALPSPGRARGRPWRYHSHAVDLLAGNAHQHQHQDCERHPVLGAPKSAKLIGVQVEGNLGAKWGGRGSRAALGGSPQMLQPLRPNRPRLLPLLPAAATASQGRCRASSCACCCRARRPG